MYLAERPSTTPQRYNNPTHARGGTEMKPKQTTQPETLACVVNTVHNYTIGEDRWGDPVTIPVAVVKYHHQQYLHLADDCDVFVSLATCGAGWVTVQQDELIPLTFLDRHAQGTMSAPAIENEPW